ncbi:TPA: phage tail fiber protein [Klebsiella pneumoniae]
MTVSTQVSRNEYTGNGATTQYDFTFRILDKSHLLVQTLDTSENIVTLTLGTDYTVTGVNRYNGGKVVLTSALPAGYKISIERSTPVTQEASIRNQGGFFPEIHEDAFDKLTMLVQQAYGWWSGLSLRKPSWLANYYDALNNRIRNLRDPSQAQDAATKSYVDSSDSDLQHQITSNFNRSLRVPDSYISQLPSAEDRAWKGLGFDGAGQPKLQDPAGSGLWGYVPVAGSFEQGSLLNKRFEVLLWESTDEYWRWDGAMPKDVLPGSTPATAGGTGKGKWIDVTDATLRSNLGSDEAGLGVNLVYGALKQVSLTNFLSLADLIRFDNKELVNFDNAIAEAKLAGLERVYLPNGHFGIADTTSFANILIVGSNKSQFGDIKLENSDGSSGKLSLETEGTVLHITGNAAATGITLSNSGSGFTSSLCGIIGCSIYYPDQDWKDWTQGTTADIDGDYYYEPTVYPPTFVADVSMRVIFDKLFFINSYHWIDIKNAQLVTFGKIAGSLLNRGYTVTRMAAGGVTENFNSYPFWTWACNFAGISSRVNHYCDAVGKAIQVGLDDGVTRTVEQMRIIHASIIGCADGIICGGKGVSIVDAKIDNVMRGITISDDDNSAYHQIGKVWVSSYYRNNYTPKQRKNGNVYGFKSNTATPIDLSGLQVVRADGRGVWMPYSSGSQVKGPVVQQCMYKAFEFGSRGRTTDVISVNGCYAGMYNDTSLTDQVAYTFGDFMRCDIKGLQWKGASNVTPYVLNNALNYYEAGKELDLTSLDGRFYKGYSNTLFTQERGLRGFINTSGASSTAEVETLRLSGTNTGAKMLNTGLGIRNTVADGTGYGALILYASLAGTATPIVEVFGDGVNTGLRPLTDASRDLGDATHRFRRGYFSESVAVGGNPVGVKVAVPASATAAGSVGQWAADSTHLYVCIAANTWVRSTLATW